jgi:hypothetical protein
LLQKSQIARRQIFLLLKNPTDDRRSMWPQSRYRGRQRVYLQANEVPHIFTRKSRLRPKEFLIASAKRLLQQNLPGADHPPGLKTARFRLAATSVCWIDRPMTLPPGQPPELATRPVPTRSPRLNKVIWRYLADPWDAAEDLAAGEDRWELPPLDMRRAHTLSSCRSIQFGRPEEIVPAIDAAKASGTASVNVLAILRE